MKRGLDGWRERETQVDQGGMILNAEKEKKNRMKNVLLRGKMTGGQKRGTREEARDGREIKLA